MEKRTLKSGTVFVNGQLGFLTEWWKNVHWATHQLWKHSSKSDYNHLMVCTLQLQLEGNILFFQTDFSCHWLLAFLTTDTFSMVFPSGLLVSKEECNALVLVLGWFPGGCYLCLVEISTWWAQVMLRVVCTHLPTDSVNPRPIIASQLASLAALPVG